MMKRESALMLLTLPVVVLLNSCATPEEQEARKQTGPVSDTSKIPWNSPIPGQGQGQFGMMPQNQYRR